MSEYQPRHIRFEEIVEIDDWSIKVYSITKDQEESSTDILQHSISQLPQWLQLNNSFNASNEKIGFLIVHIATEGVFSIINWWVGKNMLNTHIFFSPHEQTNNFKLISGDGLSPCVWELEVINHERNSWIDHVLKKPESPDYEHYLSDHCNKVV